jgi:predicted dehydrogenase
MEESNFTATNSLQLTTTSAVHRGHMNKIRVGVIGAGHNGLGWCEDYHKSATTELVAICDRDGERLAAATNRFPRADAYSDYQILERDDIDAISIHTSDHLHAEPFIKTLAAGKHAFVEKPMANSIEDLKLMLKAARAAPHLKTMVGHVLRFNPHFAMLKKLITDGHLGEIFYMEADYIHDLRYQQYMEQWKLDEEIPIVGGGVHELDLLRWYCGDIVSVKADQNHIAYREMKAPTTQVGLFTFANGAIGKVTALYGSIGARPPLANMTIYGTKGTIRRDGLALDGMEELIKLPYDYEGHPYSPQVEHFADCIIADRDVLVPAEEGAKSAQACLLAYEAATTGQTIAVKPLL